MKNQTAYNIRMISLNKIIHKLLLKQILRWLEEIMLIADDPDCQL